MFTLLNIASGLLEYLDRIFLLPYYENFACCAAIMLDAYYAQNYAGIIGWCLALYDEM